MGWSKKVYCRVCCIVSQFPTSDGRAPKINCSSIRNKNSYSEVEYVKMYLIVGLPRTRNQYDSIWVIVDRLTKTAYYIPVKSTYSVEDYGRIYLYIIVSLHGLPFSIISDSGAQHTSRF